MSRSLSSLLALLPQGRAWTRAAGTVLHSTLTAIAQEYDRVRARAADLIRESVPDQAEELLPEWEELTGATGCSDAGSLDLRRAAVVERLRGGAPTYPALDALVRAAGYNPEFVAWAPFIVGASSVGDALSNDEWQHTVGLRHETIDADSDAALTCTIEDLLHLHVYLLEEEVDWLELSDGSILELSGGIVMEAA